MKPSPPPKNSAHHSARPALVWSALWKAAAAMGALVFLIFIDQLIAPGSRVLGNQTTDMWMQFYSWREFGFGELAKGNLALWNPHIYGGAPYFGGSQAAMLYPTNWLLLFLPLGLGINWSIALNVWLLGVFTYLWAGYRGLKPLACFVAGAILMFCGPHFMHIYSGHPVHMAVMTWTPVVFLAVDGLLGLTRERFALRWLGWSLLGMFAVAMQVFAGHPQYLFYTGLTAGLYVLFQAVQSLAFRPAGGARAGTVFGSLIAPGFGLVAIFGGGAALGAVQLFAAVQATGETIRADKVPFVFASMFGFPPENLLTLLNPYFFGDMMSVHYWGRCYLWEMSLFIGAIGLALAVYGVIYGGGGGRENAATPVLQRRWVLLAVVGVTFLLALGVHTPLFQILYDHVPGFGKFRGISKFTYQTMLFAGLLAGIGFDALLRKPRAEQRFVIGVAVAGAVVLMAGAYVALLSAVDWRDYLKAIAETRESYLPPTVWNSLDFADKAREYASGALFIPGFILLGLAALLHFAPGRRWVMPAIAAACVTELFFFALHTRDTFDSNTVVLPEIRDFLAKHPGDYRSLNLHNANSALSVGAYDLWASDPGVVRRYAEFISWTQGINPDDATQYVSFRGIDPLYKMLRFRYAFVPDAKGMKVAESPDAPMERVQLISNYRVVNGRDAIFAAMREKGFDPRKEAILETEPAVKPAASDASGSVKVTASSTDWLDIEADVASPALLLVTDLYTPSWRAVALPGSSQANYELLPADYILRAVPLAAGHHKLRIEYAPRAFTVGKQVSLAAWGVFLAAAALFFALRRKAG